MKFTHTIAGKHLLRNEVECIAEIGTNVPRLLWNTKEVCEALGINPRTLARLVARGLIRPVPLTRHKQYLPSDVKGLVENLSSWKP